MKFLNFFKKKESNILLNLASLSLSIIVTIIGIEIYLTTIEYPYQGCEEVNQTAELYLGEFNEQTGWSYKRQISYYEQNNKYQYHFDNKGIRVPEPLYKIDKKKPIILFIGGSVTFGEELSYQHTFPAKIGSLLEDEFEIVNLGVQGFGTAQSMLRLRSMINDIKPKHIVYTFNFDHINRDINYDRRLHIKCSEFAGTKPIFKIKDGGIYQTHFPQKYSITDRFRIPLFLSLSYQNYKEKSLTKSGKNQEITKAIIDDISTLANKHKAKDYYIYYDTTYDLSPDNANKHLSEYLFDSHKRQKVLNFTNWASDSQTTGTKYYTNEKDFMHPNASLSTKIAEQFVEKFKQNLAE